VKIAVLAIQNCLSKGPGLQCTLIPKQGLAENLQIPAWEMCEAALQPVVVVVVVSVRREIQAGI
jgi:hypothetical protein